MLPDNEFIRDPHVTGPAKLEVRCLVMCLAGLRGHEVAVDVGCGTGGITLELAERASRVYAIDRDPRAISITGRNLEKHGLGDNVSLMNLDAVEALEGLGEIDLAVIGGSGGELRRILELASERLRDGGRIIVTAILLETKYEALRCLRDLGFEVGITEVSVSRGRMLDRGTMMVAQNPISIIYTL